MSLPEFESPLPHDKTAVNDLINSGLFFIKNYSDKTVPTFRNVKIVKGDRWYIEYYYQVPEGLLSMYNNKKWKRFRVFEDINRYKGEEKDEYADLLLQAVKRGLSEGYSPFAEKEKLFVRKEGIALTISVAVEQWKEAVGESGNDQSTKDRYTAIATQFMEFVIKKGYTEVSPDAITEDFMEELLQFFKKKNGWSNRHYNNILGYMSTMFAWMVKKRKITNNPCAGITKLSFTSHVHRYYNDEVLKKVTKWMKANDPYLYLAAQFVYYAGIRSSKELIGLQVGDILMDRQRIRFRGDATKGKRDDYIFLDPKLAELIKEAGILNYPGNYYVFTYNLKPDAVPSKEDWLQKRFRKLRKELNLEMDYTLYSMKHTRAIHLLMDGAQPVDIMQLFRHRDLTATSKYIRDLGFDLNTKFHNISRQV